MSWAFRRWTRRGFLDAGPGGGLDSGRECAFSQGITLDYFSRTGYHQMMLIFWGGLVVKTCQNISRLACYLVQSKIMGFDFCILEFKLKLLTIFTAILTEHSEAR